MLKLEINAETVCLDQFTSRYFNRKLKKELTESLQYY